MDDSVNNKLTIFNTITNIFLILVLFVGGAVWADTNGVWHRAEDVIAGTFAFDENGGDFIFPNNLNINNNLTVNNDIDLTGELICIDCISTNNLKDNLIVNSKISDDAIKRENIVDDAVNGNKIDSTTDITAQIFTGSAFYYNSDEKLKHNVVTLNNTLDKILNLRGVSFNWNKDNSTEIGLIAQEVEVIFPELVKLDKTTNISSVKYANLVAVLIEAIKEQQNQIDDLKEKINR